MTQPGEHSPELQNLLQDKQKGPWFEALQARLGEPWDVLQHVHGFNDPGNALKDDVKKRCGLYLWRFQGQQSWATATGELHQGLGPCFKDIYENYSQSLKRFRIGSSYTSFQGNRDATCVCKYDYDAASKQPAFNANHCKHDLQPRSAAETLKKTFDTLKAFTVDAPRDCAEFNLAVVNMYKDNSDFIPWHCDDMKAMSHETEEDLAQHPVLSWSLGSSQLFCIALERHHWIAKRIAPGEKWKTQKPKMNVRAAFFLNHGDILLMTGDFQRCFVHKTLPMLLNDDAERNLRQKGYQYLHLGMDLDSLPREQAPERFCITARCNKYHPGQWSSIGNDVCPLRAYNWSETKSFLRDGARAPQRLGVRPSEPAQSSGQIRGRSPVRQERAHSDREVPREDADPSDESCDPQFAVRTPSPPISPPPYRCKTLIEHFPHWYQQQQHGCKGGSSAAGSASAGGSHETAGRGPRGRSPQSPLAPATPNRPSGSRDSSVASVENLRKQGTDMDLETFDMRSQFRSMKDDADKATPQDKAEQEWRLWMTIQALVSLHIRQSLEQMTRGDGWTQLCDEKLDELWTGFVTKIKRATSKASGKDRTVKLAVCDNVALVWMNTLPNLHSLTHMADLVRYLKEFFGFTYSSRDTNLANNSYTQGFRNNTNDLRVLMCFRPLVDFVKACSPQQDGKLALADHSAQKFWKMAMQRQIQLLKVENNKFTTHDIKSVWRHNCEEMPTGWKIEISEFEVGDPDSTVMGESRGWGLSPRQQTGFQKEGFPQALANVLQMEKRHQWEKLRERDSDFRFGDWHKNEVKELADMPAIVWVRLIPPETPQSKRQRKGDDQQRQHRNPNQPWAGNYGSAWPL